MAFTQVKLVEVSVPPGTAKAAPQVTQVSFPPRNVSRLDIVFPPGPRGEVGVWVGSSGTQLIPTDAGVFIVADSETISWPLEGQHDSGSWQIAAYNTGNYTHTVRFRFLLDLVPTPAADVPAPIPASQLAGA